jgi:hypothetical protein
VILLAKAGTDTTAYATSAIQTVTPSGQYNIVGLPGQRPARRAPPGGHPCRALARVCGIRPSRTDETRPEQIRRRGS